VERVDLGPLTVSARLPSRSPRTGLIRPKRKKSTGAAPRHPRLCAQERVPRGSHWPERWDRLGIDRRHRRRRALARGRARITMPGPYTSSTSLKGAYDLARNLGINIESVSIGGVLEGYLQALRPLLHNDSHGVTEENLQARIRGNVLMAFSNARRWLVLTTGNKSELAVGYCTLYGDMAGGFAVIKDVPKDLVYRLARWRNSRDGAPPIPPDTLSRPPRLSSDPTRRTRTPCPPIHPR